MPVTMVAALGIGMSVLAFLAMGWGMRLAWRRHGLGAWGWSAALVVSFLLSLNGTPLRAVTEISTAPIAVAPVRARHSTLWLPFYKRVRRETLSPKGLVLGRETTKIFQLPVLFLIVLSGLFVSARWVAGPPRSGRETE